MQQLVSESGKLWHQLWADPRQAKTLVEAIRVTWAINDTLNTIGFFDLHKFREILTKDPYLSILQSWAICDIPLHKLVSEKDYNVFRDATDDDSWETAFQYFYDNLQAWWRREGINISGLGDAFYENFDDQRLAISIRDESHP